MSHPTPHRAGFTLIELMIVVVIIGVLAVIAVPVFTQYVYRSRMTEATTFLGEIRQRQESYRAEFGTYVSAPSAGTGWGDFTPTALDGPTAQAWPGNIDAWNSLGARPDGMVRFQYATISGPPTTTPPGGLGYDGSDFWFVAQAKGDMDNDGTTVTVEAYSASNGIWISEAKGWE